MKFVPNGISRNVGRQILKAKKNSPHIFFAAGIVGVVGGAVLACKATLKLEETLDEIQTEIKDVKDISILSDSADEKEYYRDLGYVYGKSSVKLARLYGPAIVVGGISIAALSGSHIQLTRRNTALSATIAVVSKAYEEYRVRVQEAIGEDRERDIYHNASTESATVDGKKEIVKVVDPNGFSMYARMFDEANPNWEKNSEMNRIFIQCQQNYANQKLQSRGHLFLNEVYDMLGMERSQAGQVVGWVLNGDGDNYVDFGLFEAMSSRFINNMERSIILDFNVDGVVYDLI